MKNSITTFLRHHAKGGTCTRATRLGVLRLIESGAQVSKYLATLQLRSSICYILHVYYVDVQI